MASGIKPCGVDEQAQRIISRRCFYRILSMGLDLSMHFLAKIPIYRILFQPKGEKAYGP
jgi:hypothetical protein